MDLSLSLFIIGGYRRYLYPSIPHISFECQIVFDHQSISPADSCPRAKWPHGRTEASLRVPFPARCFALRLLWTPAMAWSKLPSLGGLLLKMPSYSNFMYIISMKRSQEDPKYIRKREDTRTMERWRWKRMSWSSESVEELKKCHRRSENLKIR